MLLCFFFVHLCCIVLDLDFFRSSRRMQEIDMQLLHVLSSSSPLLQSFRSEFSRVMMQQDHATQRGGGNNARGERDGDADADGDGDGRKGRGLIGREVTRVPPLPSSLPSFFIYISCVVKRTETSYLKMGGARELDHWMDHLVLGQEAFSLLLASSHCIIILLAMCFCIIDLSAGSSHAPSDPVSLFMIHPSITH